MDWESVGLIQIDNAYGPTDWQCIKKKKKNSYGLLIHELKKQKKNSYPYESYGSSIREKVKGILVFSLCLLGVSEKMLDVPRNSLNLSVAVHLHLGLRCSPLSLLLFDNSINSL